MNLEGSGIAWHGACTMFSMSGSWGTEQRGIQCQMPQTTHRALSTPFALFGLGRSPNFIDYGKLLPINCHYYYCYVVIIVENIFSTHWFTSLFTSAWSFWKSAL